ncbi:MAG: cation-translocating P-type ATPase [Jiangellales bacterium]
MSTGTTSHDRAWYAVDVSQAATSLRTDPSVGLSGADAARRLKEDGPNSIPKEPPPSRLSIAAAQLADPMNVMLVVVALISLAIGEASTGLLVGALVLLNVVLGTNQEMKAQASVAALDQLQVPSARVLRDGTLVQLDALDLVVGDLVMLEAGDLVPADGRITTSATLEVAEAALTGESAPVAKDASTLDSDDVPLGDRSNMLFQNTSVTRGTAALMVTATGSGTEMGKIAGLLTSVTRTKSPLQKELDGVTRWLGLISWLAVALIVVVGWFRELEFSTLVLLAVSTAIAAIPTGLPTFVQAMLSSGARRLADAKAVVKNLTDVETLGSTSAINSDKTGTLTMNEMTAVSMLTGGSWYSVQGSGYEKAGAILHTADDEVPDFTPLALGLTLCSDATVSDSGTVVGDPTEAALVVLAAKIGVDAEVTRREVPRLAEVPFDSAYKFMATFHEAPRRDASERVVEAVKGAPDVVLDRCSQALWHGEVVPLERVRAEVEAANASLSGRGLRVLSFAVRFIAEDERDAVAADPMSYVDDLVFVSLVGIIDPLRPSAKTAVATALRAGIDVRMITGDHAITARAIADDLGLADGIITGSQLQRATDEELLDRLDHLHVFGRVAPEDKLRLVELMQRDGTVVAMTGDAVNDAAALKQADIGVAMGSGSEVTKQAAKMILTDDNFATLVKAIELGRDIYGKISAYLRYQLQGLFGVLLLMIIATVFNINSGAALTPGMLLFVNFVIGVFPVLAIISDGVDPTIMDRPPRASDARVVNRGTVIRWATVGLVLAVSATIPLVLGPDEPSLDGPSVSMTMAFVVSALAALGLGWTARRDPGPSFDGPPFPYLAWITGGAALLVLSVELEAAQGWLQTTSLTGGQWVGAVVLALVAPAVAAVEKEVRRRRQPAAPQVSSMGELPEPIGISTGR